MTDKTDYPDLPELPKAGLEHAIDRMKVLPYYTADQMREYAALAVKMALSETSNKHTTAIATAYGYLWHVAHPDVPAPISLDASTAAYRARRALRDLLTHAQRGEAINAIRELLFEKIEPSKLVYFDNREEE